MHILTQADPMIRLTHSLLNLYLFECCVNKGPSWLPTVSGHWLTANVSKASQNQLSASISCSNLQTKSDIASKWLGSKHNPQRQPIWIKQVPNTLQMTIGFAAITQTNPSFTSTQTESTSTLQMGHFKKKLGIISPGHSILPNVTLHGRR